MPETRLFVLSDLHAHDARFIVPSDPTAPTSSPGKPSWLDYSDRASTIRDPIFSLHRLLSDTDIKADFLIVPGDISHQANGDALRQAWKDIEALRVALGAAATIATVGNHDLDSRYRAHPYDPRNVLMSLAPAFPVMNDDANAAFWGFGISEVTHGGTRFVIVNSCAFHGGASGELAHGRISELALNRLGSMLGAANPASVNVLVCHHHPYPISGNAYGRDDRMTDGETLLDVLDASGKPWLVIHGHRHAARLLYSGGSANSPVILAAGSATVRLSPPLSTTTRNQAHLVSVSPGSDPLEMNGIVDTWNYNPVVGWEVASRDAGLPLRCGFGYRGSLTVITDQIKVGLQTKGGPLLWEEITRVAPQILHITPRDFERLKDRLTAAGVGLLPSGQFFEAAEL